MGLPEGGLNPPISPARRPLALSLNSMALMIWRNMTTNEEFHLQSDGTIYRSGPRCEADFRPNPGGVLVETISSIPDFLRSIQNGPEYLVEYLHKSLLPRQTRKVAAVGRKVVWARWIYDGKTYELKSDYTIRDTEEHTIAGRLSPTTDVSKFIASLRQDGHEVLFVHPRVHTSKAKILLPKDIRAKVNA